MPSADPTSDKLILLLNSDAYAKPGAIERLAQVFVDPTVVAAGGRLLHPDGRLQNSCANRLTLWALFCEQTYLEKLFPSSRIFSPYWTSHLHHCTAEVEQVMGACLMMRPLERFDERFFLYCEDTELCHRLKKHGKILYVPEAEFVHELGASSSMLRWKAIAQYNKGKELYFRIHYGKYQAWSSWLINKWGATLRFVFWGLVCIASLGLHKKARQQVSIFARVLFS